MIPFRVTDGRSAYGDEKECRQMKEEFYRELDPEKRWKILQNEPESEEKERAQEFFLLRHTDEKTGQNDFQKDRFLWFLVTMELEGSRRPTFAKMEAKRTLRDLHKLLGSGNGTGATDSSMDGLLMDTLFLKEMRNAVERFFSTSSQDGDGRRLLGVAQSDKEMRLADQAMDAWRLIYGAPMYLNLRDELKPLCDLIRDVYLSLDPGAAGRLEAADRRKQPKKYKK